MAEEEEKNADSRSRTAAASLPRAKRSPKPRSVRRPNPQSRAANIATKRRPFEAYARRASGSRSRRASGAQAEASAAYQKAASSQPGAQDIGPQDLTFASFVVGLSTEALALMGEMPHPATGERMHDLLGAQQLIDIIGILQEKTRGNLSHDEDTLIDAILFDLRMKYVEKARLTPR